MSDFLFDDLADLIGKRIPCKFCEYEVFPISDPAKIYIEMCHQCFNFSIIFMNISIPLELETIMEKDSNKINQHISENIISFLNGVLKELIKRKISPQGQKSLGEILFSQRTNFKEILNENFLNNMFNGFSFNVQKSVKDFFPKKNSKIKIKNILKEIPGNIKTLDELQDKLIDFGSEKKSLEKEGKKVPDELKKKYELYRKVYKKLTNIKE